MSDTEKIEWVTIDEISVPRERVTSVWDPAIEEEFLESVKTKGILEPITLMRIGQDLWLIDGLHRIQVAERLHQAKVPARIIQGSIEELLIQNIIRNRQRGKSNPAQEAEVLSILVEKQGFPPAMAAKQLGMSESWAQKLLKISRLPDEIKDQLKHGKIPVSGAVYIADLPRPEDQVNVAHDAEYYDYTVDQIKRRVWQLLNPDYEAEPGEVTFKPTGEPARVPLTCHFCGAVLSSKESYVWTCAECLNLARDTIEYYHKTYVTPPAGPEPGKEPGPPQGSS